MSWLRDLDRVLGPLSWIAAGVVVLMLIFGPAVIANDQSSGSSATAGAAMYGSGPGVNAASVFKANCGSCHTLTAAGTHGQIGPNLDNTTFSVSQIEAQIRNGGGGMPAFAGKLSDAQIAAVAAFVDAAR